MLTLVGWHSRQALLEPMCGFVPCVVGVRYSFCAESQRWHSWLQAELGEESPAVDAPGMWQDQQL